MNKIKFINSNCLKIIAMILMLLDHLWATIVPGNQWMTLVGRMAFPIFAFLLVEGFMHTSDYKKYLKRLFIFALISEIPFNLIYTGSWFFPFHQNVLFTLILGLLCINEIDKFKKDKKVKGRIKNIFKILLFLLFGLIGFVDYGITGILTIIVFYLFRGFKFAWIGQLISLILLYWVFFKGQVFIVGNIEITLQSFGILSLIPIWLYNGKRGKKSKVLQYGFYAFYPLHMLCLYLIYYLFF